jgi:hypothetical protein
MSRRYDVQSAEGPAATLHDYRGYGLVQAASKTAPTNGVVGYAPGCLWHDVAGTAATGFTWINIGGNGFGTNPTALWIENDPSSSGGDQFGGEQTAGTGGAGGLPTFISSSGNIYRNVYAAGSAPGSTGSDICVDWFGIPANALNAAFKGFSVTAAGQKTATSDTVVAKIWLGPTSAPVVGTAVTTGTVIATTGSITGTTNEGWLLQSQVFATGPSAQVYQETATIVGSTHGGMGIPAALALTSTAIIYIAVTINVTTTAADGLLWWWDVDAMN